MVTATTFFRRFLVIAISFPNFASKNFDQIADLPDSYILADNMEYPIGKKLPLWIVGFLY